ncbi:MAG: hypothetical protein R3B72_51250 [Polyangiaceae bacterium]
MASRYVPLKIHNFDLGKITLLEPQELEAEQMVDGLLLRIPGTISLTEQVDAKNVVGRPIVRGLRAEVRWKGRLVGHAFDPTPMWTAPLDDTPFKLELAVTASTVQRVERERDGKSPRFTLTLRGDVQQLLEPKTDLRVAVPGGDEPEARIRQAPSWLSRPYPIPTDIVEVTYTTEAWVGMLHRTGVGENVVVEVPLPPAPVDPEWEQVWSHLRQARNHLAHGGSTGWGHVMVETRKALEVWHRIEEPQITEDPNRPLRQRTVDQRARALRRYLQEFSHPAAHAHTTHFEPTREDAVLALATLAALLARRNP